MDVEKRTLQFIGFVQIVLGLVFLFIPNSFANASNFENPPVWVLWMFMQMAARFIGYGIGMFAAATDPIKHAIWIRTMILVQAIDWIATLWFLFKDDLKLSQVSTAPFFPILFIAILVYYQLNPQKKGAGNTNKS